MNGYRLYLRVLSLMLSAVMLFTSFIISPVSSLASDIYEDKVYTAADGEIFRVDHTNNEYWVVSNSKWHRCIYNDDRELTALTNEVRNAMYNREPVYSAYFIVKNEYVYDSMTGSDIVAFRNEYIYKIFNEIHDRVFQDNVTPYGGDYLRFLTDSVSLDKESGFLVASDSSDEYSFLRIKITFKYESTLAQEQQVNEYFKEWNQRFIFDNPVISAADGDKREYYIVKTIYNFLTKNTIYDSELYQDRDHIAYPEDSDRYRISHTAFGTLFGNIVGANQDDFSYKKYYDDNDGNTICEYRVNMSTITDNQGLYRIGMMNQGRSVCEGYTLAFYYLCKLNNIDCRIVTGDYTDEAGKESDPHAWNEVYLKDYLDNGREWYLVDATFGTQHSQKVTDEFAILDYDYFLRGTSNKSFSPEKHQQKDTLYANKNMSVNDYRFKLENVDFNTAYAVVTRRRNEDKDLVFVSEGVYNLENYLIIGADGVFYRIKRFIDNGDGTLTEIDDNEPYQPGVEYVYKYNVVTDGFKYYSGNDGYWYSLNIYDFAQGVEYLCDDMKLKDVGTYDFIINNPDYDGRSGKRSISVSSFDMGNMKNYDLSKTECPRNAYFIGADINIDAKIYDYLGTKLEYGKDYTIHCYREGDRTREVKPHEFGDYTIIIQYHGNYNGSLEFPLTVVKTDMSILGTNTINTTYGIDIPKGLDKLNLGEVTLYRGVDYCVEVDGNTNYNDSGDIIIEALNGSKYLESGTCTVWHYNISERRDLTSVFNGMTISGERYTYTGKQIKPSDFTLYDFLNGNKIKLIKDKDYRIVEDGYGENIKVGKGTVKVEFIGNYKGTATLSFDIDAPLKFDVTVPDLTYNGKNQTPSPKVMCAGAQLVKGVDYTVSGTAKAPGIYICTVQGIGAYSNISGRYTYFIKPSNVSGLKRATATSTTLKLSWNSQGGSAIYQVYAYDTTKKKWMLIGETMSNSVNISAVYLNGKKTALKPATKYQFKIRAYIGANNGAVKKYSGYTAVLNAYTIPKTPAVTKLTKSKTNLKVTWKRDTAVTGYQIQLATNTKFTAGKKSKTVSKNATVTTTFTGLKKGKTYYVRMRSYKKVGSVTYYSPYSKTVKVKL